MIDSIWSLSELNLKEKYINKIQECITYLELLEYVEEIILFGSCARAECVLGSDVDLLVITERQTSRLERGMIYNDLCYKSYGISSDIVFVSRAQYEEDDSRLLNNVKREGKILWKK